MVDKNIFHGESKSVGNDRIKDFYWFVIPTKGPPDLFPFCKNDLAINLSMIIEELEEATGRNGEYF